MLQIRDTLVSLDIVEKQFVCNLQACKGICCVHGDSGAPLEEEEKNELAHSYSEIEPYMRAEGRKAVEEQGVSVIDEDGDLVTPLINGRECAYTYLDKGIYKCAIEKAWLENKITFRKPVSCHLFPVRLREYEKYTAVNFEFWRNCLPALELGKKTGTYMYEFLEEALTRRFGKKWFLELREAAKAYRKQFKNQ